MMEDHRGLIPSPLRLGGRGNNGKTLAGRACRLRLPMDGEGGQPDKQHLWEFVLS